jgi:hypothetical protein
MQERVSNQNSNVCILGFCSVLWIEAQSENLVTAVEAIRNSASQASTEGQSEPHQQHKQPTRLYR